MSQIRGFLTFSVNYAGLFSDNPTYLCHENGNPITEMASGNYKIRRVDLEYNNKFRYVKSVQEGYKKGCKALSEFKMFKLLELAKAVLSFSFIDVSEKEITPVQDISYACGFLLQIQKIPGY